MLLQRLATGATGVNKRDTGEGLFGAARHSYAHAQYIHNASVCAVEFRRGFCTLVLSFTIVGICTAYYQSRRAWASVSRD